MLRNADGTIVHGRTLEFGVVVDSMIASFLKTTSLSAKHRVARA